MSAFLPETAVTMNEAYEILSYTEYLREFLYEASACE